MNLKEWYITSTKGEWSNVLPVFKIDQDNPAKEIIKELEKLDIFKGNICSSVEDAKFIDVWYKDFYNTFYVYTRSEDDEEFFVTLKELKELVKEENKNENI